jgi:hypothetical protein
MFRTVTPVFPAVLALYWPFCTPELRPSQPPALAQIEELWKRPDDIAEHDLFHAWGREHAPTGDGRYRFVKPKTGGVNPGMTVADSRGREWSVKQASHDPDRGDEGPVEVVLSHVLSAVVRDLGMALGNTGRFNPTRGNPELFEREPFIERIENDVVHFNYRGWHQDLIDRRITPDDVACASELLGRLSLAQWRAAFRAGGYATPTADPFIRRLLTKIEEGHQLASTAGGG